MAILRPHSTGNGRRHFGTQTQDSAAGPRWAVDEVQAKRLASAVRIGFLTIAGALPVLSISAHVFGVLTIDHAALYLVLPASLIALVLASGSTPEATPLRYGVLAGLVAVTLYDSTRVPFIVSGMWADFIPDVGGWVVRSNGPHAFLGYFWRYLGNGGGMAAIFALACALLGIRRHVVALGVGYGVFVWSGLLGTLTLSAAGERLLFEITPLTFTVSLIGHLVYGSVLGWLYARWIHRGRVPTELPASELALVARLRETRWIRALR
jgi:hypothetical protein